MSQDVLDDFNDLDKEKSEFLEEKKSQFVYIGFFNRLGATILDAIFIPIIMYLSFVLIGVIDVLMATKSSPIVVEFIFGLIFLFYFPIMESSSLQGSFGKTWSGMKVVDEQGNRLSFGRAFGRFILKFFSLAIVFLGFIMIAFTKNKQGLHDIIAETYVVEK